VDVCDLHVLTLARRRPPASGPTDPTLKPFGSETGIFLKVPDGVGGAFGGYRGSKANGADNPPVFREREQGRG
jgi:hypothetical protein